MYVENILLQLDLHLVFIQGYYDYTYKIILIQFHKKLPSPDLPISEI